jgi:purine-nucleoside phosphorylase
MDLDKVKESVEYLEERLNKKVDLSLILGSGLGVLAKEIEDAIVFPYADIPNFPTSTVEGHSGQLVVGNLKGKNVIVMQGRFHYYEGYEMKEVTFPVRVMKLLGADKIVVTNSAGGVNRNYNVGDLMIINDHLNFMGTNPLIGSNQSEFGPRFPDMSEAYSERLIEMTESVAEEIGINLRKGVYLAMTGPSYETPAEIRCISRLGADAVGMSTVPEVIVANHMDMEVLGISCITNMAAGILPQALDHDEVIETTRRVKSKFIRLVKGIVEEI